MWIRRLHGAHILGLSLIAGLSPIGAAEEEAPAPDADAEAGEVLGAQRITMAPMNISLFESNRLAARINIELILVVQDLKNVADIKARLPQLRSDFLTALNQLARDRFSVDRPLEPDLIKLYTLAFAEQRLGPGVVDVFVHQAYIQPL